MDGENLSVSVEVEPDILNMKDEDSVSFFCGSSILTILLCLQGCHFLY